MLSNSKTLKVLHIHGYCSLNEFKQIANCKNILLQSLNVSHCGLNSSSLAEIIGEMLSHNKAIKLVDLSDNCITDEGMAVLVHHLMDNNTLQQINLRCNKITADGVTHLRKLITKNSTLISIKLSDNPLMDEGVDLLLKSLPLGIKHIGLCDVQMTSLSCQSLGNALHKVKSISFDQLIEFKISSAVSNQNVSVTCEYVKVINNYVKKICNDFWEVITTNLLRTTVLEHLELRLTDVPTIELVHAIGQNKSIEMLKLLFWMGNPDIICTKSNWGAELAQYIEHSTSLEQLTISGITEDNPSRIFQLLTDSLTINTSIKSMVYELKDLYDYGVYLSNVYEFIDKLKENNTLEELTLNEVPTHDMDNELFATIENYVQQINKIRSIKGIANLKVSMTSVCL